MKMLMALTECRLSGREVIVAPVALVLSSLLARVASASDHLDSPDRSTTTSKDF
jgi:hypothetical protein